LDPKGVKTLERGDSRKKKDFVKVEDGGVYCKRYDGHCMKQIKIPKVI
jgi:hypothetical protein